MKDLKEKNDKQIGEMLTEKREELRVLRFGVMGKSRDVLAVRKTRKDIARMLTEARARVFASHVRPIK